MEDSLQTKKGNTQQPPREDEVSAGAAAMCELFHAIGFEILDEQAYNRLVEYVEANGVHTRIDRGDAALHGRCVKLGNGLEVWSVLFERGVDLYYADCRPAFRSRYTHTVSPWELIEYDEDGEAIVRGKLLNGPDVVFELQNLTEVSARKFREPEMQVALAGIAYWAEVPASGMKTRAVKQFQLAEGLADYAGNACESDYVIVGEVLALREFSNPATGARLYWLFVDAGSISLELIVNGLTLGQRVKIGTLIKAGVWLQGHVLTEPEISARYEGVDPDHQSGESWAVFRRTN
ncbi:MAG TPA: DUF3881 family protein [Blastocatellia bacterium]|nr:DUF3881 family protein [Blastocatellia bacterium]